MPTSNPPVIKCSIRFRHTCILNSILSGFLLSIMRSDLKGLFQIKYFFLFSSQFWNTTVSYKLTILFNTAFFFCYHGRINEEDGVHFQLKLKTFKIVFIEDWISRWFKIVLWYKHFKIFFLLENHHNFIIKDYICIKNFFLLWMKNLTLSFHVTMNINILFKIIVMSVIHFKNRLT